jgi:predicted AlkP superfamily pyrophosphatase or phosphodiesterase
MYHLIVSFLKINEMKFRLLLFLSLFYSIQLGAQNQPKLVVGIVVDQMRADYLYRYWEKFGDDGFKRLIREGFQCKNAHYNYIPTYTAPGHASIFTGTTPMNHGIIANDWFDKSSGRSVYCVDDPNMKAVGTQETSGQRSPHRLLATTLGDAIRISTQFKGKSIGISLKDRSAILPIGHSGNAAYWFDYKSGNFITSSYYQESLPAWVKAFNQKRYPDELSKKGWHPSLALDYYKESTSDDTPYERVFAPATAPTFPYDLPAMIKAKDYSVFAFSPFGNTILRLLADHAIVDEDLGQDEYTDLLTLSFSTPDIAGHAFGPQSIEIEDIYIRLDQEIAALLTILDERVGKDEYTLFLTADHAAAQVPAYMKDNRIPMDYFDGDAFEAQLASHLNEQFGQGEWVLNYSNQQVFLNHDLIDQEGKETKGLMEEVVRITLDYPGVSKEQILNQLQHPLPDDQFARMARMGWNPLRSGDVTIQYLVGWLDYPHTGTSHGSAYNYDSHVPLIFYGKGVAQGLSVDPVDITQIAPTVSVLSSIAFPEISDHRVISDVIAP